MGADEPGESGRGRWVGIQRPYRPSDAARLRGSVRIEHTLATLGAQRLWRLLQTEDFVPTLGALTGGQAVQMVQAGLLAVYVSGWQVAADANSSFQTYPDQSLYPADSVPNLVRRINQAFQREDEKQHASGEGDTYWFAPIVADGEAGFGGNLNVFELTKALIAAGVAGVHFEDQLASSKKCGHLGGKVLVPTREFNQKLWAARLAADVCGVPTLLIARTDAVSAKLLTSDVDPRDHPYLTGHRTPEGFFGLRAGIEAAIGRSLSYAPFADLLWFESEGPDLDEARTFAEAIHARFPGKMLAYNCSPSFNWVERLGRDAVERFQSDLGDLGYTFQFVTLAGFHASNHAMFRLAADYRVRGMAAYSELQNVEFASQAEGYQAVKHQKFVGTAYFDDVAQVLSGGLSSTLAMAGSTETAQFHDSVRSRRRSAATKRRPGAAPAEASEP